MGGGPEGRRRSPPGASHVPQVSTHRGQRSAHQQRPPVVAAGPVWGVAVRHRPASDEILGTAAVGDSTCSASSCRPSTHWACEPRCILGGEDKLSPSLGKVCTHRGKVKSQHKTTQHYTTLEGLTVSVSSSSCSSGQYSSSDESSSSSRSMSTNWGVWCRDVQTVKTHCGTPG